MPKNNTRLKMVAAAADLFQLHGVNGTSVDQILEKSNTGKSQFSHYFKTKAGLVHATLEFVHRVIQDGEAATDYNVKTWKDLDRWFQSFIDFQRSVNFERSCPVGTIANDITGAQKLLRRDAVKFLSWSRKELSRFFTEREKAGELARTIDPDSLADFCIAIMQGGMLLTKIKRKSDMFENAAHHARAYLKALRT